MFSAPQEFHKVLDRSYNQSQNDEVKSDDDEVFEKEEPVKKRGNTVRFANI